MFKAILKVLSVGLVGLTLAPSDVQARDRTADLKSASLFLGGELPSPEEILRGPVSVATFGRDEIVHCVYWEFKPGGTNPKFGCFLAAANGSYLRNGALNYVDDNMVLGDFYDTAGTLRETARLDVAKAVFVGEGGAVISAFKPLLLKIKYNDTNVVRVSPDVDLGRLIAGRRQPPYRKARDMYTEVAATRLFWALGYPVQPTYSTAAVVCHGCPEENAFKQRGRRRTMVYIDAMVDRPYPGAVELSNWSVREIVDRIYWEDWPPQKRLYFDGLLVLSGLIHHRSNAGKQNSLVCPRGTDSTCAAGSSPVMLIADLGSTFGAPHAKGQYSSWIQHPAWKDAASCRVYLRWKDLHGPQSHLRVTEHGRRFIMGRMARLTDNHLRAVFRSARFEWVDGQLRLQKYLELFSGLATEEEVPQELLFKAGLKDPDFKQLFPILRRLEARLTAEQLERLNSAVVDQWVASFQAKLERMNTEVTSCGTVPYARSRRAR